VAPSVGETVVLIQEDEVDESGAEQDYGADTDEYNEISVPLTIVLSVIAGYIIVGTVLFGLWEGCNSAGRGHGVSAS